MPYFLKKYPKGWKVVDDKGHFYSKRFLTKTRATDQMRALYAQTTHTGKGYTVYNWGGNTHYVLHGKGRFTEWIKKGARKVGEVAKKLVAPGLKAVRDLTAPITRQNNYPPKVRNLIDQYKNCLIKSAYARRFPIYDMLEKVLNFISANKFGEIKRRLGYDKLFHLSLVVGVQCPDGRKLGIMIEKNEVINITTDYKDDGPDTQLFQIPVPVAIRFGAFLEKAQQSVGPSFFQYDAFQNNCQIFVRNLLQANGLLNPQVEGFIMQDTLSLVKQLPDYVAPFASVVTNIAGIADRFIEGEGKPQLVGAGKWKNKLKKAYETEKKKIEEGRESAENKAIRLASLDKYKTIFDATIDNITTKTPVWELGEWSDSLRKPAKESVLEAGKKQFKFITTATIVGPEDYARFNINPEAPNGMVAAIQHNFPGGSREVPLLVRTDFERDYINPEDFAEETLMTIWANTDAGQRVLRELRQDPEADGATFTMANPMTEGRGKLEGAGFFDDVGDWFKTTFTGQRDTYPLQPLYDVIELIGPAPLATDYGFNELEMSRGQRQSAQLALQDPKSIFRQIEEKKADRYEAARRKLYAEGKSTIVINNELRKLANKAPYYRDWLSKEEWCQYETQRAKTQNRPPPTECGASEIKPAEGQTFDAARQGANLCAWLQTPTGVQYKQAVQLWNSNKKEVEQANEEIVKNNEMIEAENQKIRECNDSVGCSLKTALTNITDVVSWIPGPVGTIAGLANTGLSFFGGRRLPAMPDLTIEQFDAMYGKPPTRDQYPAGPDGDAKYKAVMNRRTEMFEARKKGISPVNPTSQDYVERGKKIVEEFDRQKEARRREYEAKVKSFPDIVLPQCGPAADRTEEYRSAGISQVATGMAPLRAMQRGRGKHCCGKCEKKNDGSCRMKGGCGMCGGSNGVMRGGIRIADVVSARVGRPINNLRELNDAIAEYGEQQLIEDLILHHNVDSEDLHFIIQAILPSVGERAAHNNSFYEMLDLLDDLLEQTDPDRTRPGSPVESVNSENEGSGKPKNELVNTVVMDRKDYLAEHKRLIGTLDDIRKKATAEEKKQKAEPALKKGAGRKKKTAFKEIHWGTFTKQWKAYKKHKFATLKEFANYIEKNPKEFKPITFKRALFYNNVVLKGGNKDPADSEVEAINRNYKNLIDREAQKIVEIAKKDPAAAKVALHKLQPKYHKEVWEDIADEAQRHITGAIDLIRLKRGKGSGEEKKYTQRLKHPEEKDRPPRAAVAHERSYQQYGNFGKVIAADPSTVIKSLSQPSPRPLSRAAEKAYELKRNREANAPLIAEAIKRATKAKAEAKAEDMAVKAAEPPAVMPPMFYAAYSRAATKPKDEAEKKGKGKAKAAPVKKGGPVELPFSRDEYLKRVRAAANAAGYDGRALEFSDKPDKKFMIYDDKGKKHYFGAKSYGDFIIWSAVDKEKAEQKKKVFHASHSKIKGNWASNKYSPNSLALAILW